MINPELSVRGYTSMSLIVHYCKCGELNVHGFWQQLDPKPKYDLKRRTVSFELACRECGLIQERRRRLTTAKVTRHRLVDWTRLFWWTLKLDRLLPQRAADWLARSGFYQRGAGWALWLECHCPI